MFEALAALFGLIVSALAGALGWERRKRRKLEDEQIARLNAMRDANLAALKRRDEAVAARPPMPDERPSRFDDFEKPR